MSEKMSKERDYICKLDSEEKLYKMYATQWFSGESEDDDKLRYYCVGKLGKIVMEVGYTLFVQQKGKEGINLTVLLDEGKCTLSMFDKVWEDFIEKMKEHFKLKDNLPMDTYDFVAMDEERGERIFNSIVMGEV